MPASAKAYKQTKERAGHSHSHSLSHAKPSQRSPTSQQHSGHSPRRHPHPPQPSSLLPFPLPRGLPLSAAAATSARNAFALLSLLACLAFSVVSLGRHLLEDPSVAAGLEAGGGGGPSASFSGGVFSDPSDQLINFEEQVGLVQLHFWDTTQGQNESAAPSPTASSDASSDDSSDASSDGASASSSGALLAAGKTEAHPNSKGGGTPKQKLKSEGQKGPSKPGVTTGRGGSGSGTDSGRGRTGAGGATGGAGGTGGVPGASKHALPSTAVCLSGSARFFDASGPSILRHLVGGYARGSPHGAHRGYAPSGADVLVNAPLDAGAAKLWLLLRLPRLAALRVVPPTGLPEAALSQGVLPPPSSPGGIQAVLQHMRLVEGCLELVQQREKRARSVYQWVVHARLDSYWTGPPPALGALDRQRYTVPRGKGLAAYSDISGYSDAGGGGCNDLFGVGTRATSTAAMRRISALRGLKNSRKYKKLSPQGAYAAQLALAHVAVSRAPLPFCTLVRLGPQGAGPGCTPALASLASPGPLDGAPCMPCTPCPSSSRDSKAAAAELLRNMGFKKPQDAPGVQACSLRDAWREGQWERRFDAAAGRALASDRRLVTAILKSQQTCTERWQTLRARTQAWAAPSPTALCLRAWMGEPTLLGEGPGAYSTFLRPLTNNSLVISAATSAPPRGTHGADKSWEEALRRAVGGRVLTWHLAELNSTAASLAPLKATRIDVLKLGPGEGEFRALDLLLAQFKEIPVCQLLVTFPKPTPALLASLKGGKGGREAPKGPVSQKLLYLYAGPLGRARLQLSSCWGGQPEDPPERCHFFSLKFCRH